jgi:hypothetical protein
VAETVGSLVDKICIAELKIYHTREQTERTDVGEEHIAMCKSRLAILAEQRDDLGRELDEIVKAWQEGRWKPRVYRQFKMYNDPRFKIPTS